jgi:uncharacterized protein YkwD
VLRPSVMTPAALALPVSWLLSTSRHRITHPGRPCRRRLAAVLLTLCVGLGACATGGPRPVTPIHVDASRAARLISAYRAQNGLGPVRVDSRLMQVTTEYARVMGGRDTIKHGIGGSLPRRLSAVGYDWGYAAENLGASYDTLAAVMRGWKDSPGHRKNLLSPYATEIGIAAVATPAGSDHRNYWALVLAAPRAESVVAGTSILRGAQ